MKLKAQSLLSILLLFTFAFSSIQNVEAMRSARNGQVVTGKRSTETKGTSEHRITNPHTEKSNKISELRDRRTFARGKKIELEEQKPSIRANTVMGLLVIGGGVAARAPELAVIGAVVSGGLFLWDSSVNKKRNRERRRFERLIAEQDETIESITEELRRLGNK